MLEGKQRKAKMWKEYAMLWLRKSSEWDLSRSMKRFGRTCCFDFDEEGHRAELETCFQWRKQNKKKEFGRRFFDMDSDREGCELLGVSLVLSR